MPSKKLAVYRAKRDFGRTREPSGAEKVAAGPQLRFVILRNMPPPGCITISGWNGKACFCPGR